MGRQSVIWRCNRVTHGFWCRQTLKKPRVCVCLNAFGVARMSMSINLPGSSTKVKIESDTNSQHSEVSKVLLKDALVYCEKVLLESNLIATESPTVLSEEGILLGKKIYRKILDTVEENKMAIEDMPPNKKIDEDEVIMFEELDEDGVFEEVEAVVRSNPRSEDEYEPEEEGETSERDYVPMDYKRKVVNLAKEHPKWSLKTLQRKGASRLKNMNQLKRWEEHVRNGGNKIDKYETIDSMTYDRFKKARESSQLVTSRILQQWALSAASQFPDLNFKASNSWVKYFKRKHRIRQKKINVKV